MLSGQNQAAPFWFGNGIPKLPGCVDPKTNSVLGVAEGAFLCRAMRGASREFRHFGDESFVFFAPIDDDFVFDHCLRPSLAFRITTGPVWFGTASHWRLPVAS